MLKLSTLYILQQVFADYQWAMVGGGEAAGRDESGLAREACGGLP